MPILGKDSLVLVLRACSDGGYYTQLYHFNGSPPPGSHRLLEALDNAQDAVDPNVDIGVIGRRDDVHQNKTELNNAFTSFINGSFDT